jgi:hypothetical protein
MEHHRLNVAIDLERQRAEPTLGGEAPAADEQRSAGPDRNRAREQEVQPNLQVAAGVATWGDRPRGRRAVCDSQAASHYRALGAAHPSMLWVRLPQSVRREGVDRRHLPDDTRRTLPVSC